MTTYQMAELKEIVSYAYHHTAYYKRLYDDMHIDIKSISSIEELPLISAQDLRNNPHEFKTDENIYKVVMTSGTTSTPKILYRTIEDFHKSVSNECLLLKWADINSQDIVCIVQPFGINGYGELTLEACNQLGIFAVPIGDVSDELILSAIRTFSPTVLDISPSRLISLLPHLEKEYNSIRIAMVAGEQISSSFKDVIKSKYGINVINQYGSTELDGLAAEKYNEDGLLLLSDSFIYEVIDRQLVVTSLYHKGTPLIRYILGDIVDIENDRIYIHGRKASIQLTDGIILDQSDIDIIVSKYHGLNWQCVIYSNKKTLHLTFYIYGDDIDFNSLTNEFINSFDFEDLAVQNKIRITCEPTKYIIGNTRKSQKFYDVRTFSNEFCFELLQFGCIAAFYYSLPRLTTSNMEKIFSRFNSIDTDKLIELGIFITHFWDSRTWKLNPRLLHYCYKRDSKLLLSTCIKMAKSLDWEEREEAAKFIAIIIINEFESIRPWIYKNILSKNENIRRGFLLAIKYCVEYDTKQERRTEYISFLDYFLFDKSVYVKKSFDSFTIGDGFLNICPDLVEKKLDEWVSRNDERINCMVIRVFKSSGGANTWPLGKKYLDLFSNDNSYLIQKALNATLDYLKKRVNLED